ncbi:MAG: hypothetical protein P8Z50_08040, partial [candidate division WOR-3 bacterium]
MGVRVSVDWFQTDDGCSRIIFKSYLKIFSLILSIIIYFAPAILLGENDFSSLSPHLGNDAIHPDESLFEYPASDSAEFDIAEAEEPSAEEDLFTSPGNLTITTYYIDNGYNEGHLIVLPDSTTLSVDCAGGDISTISHFHEDHCGSPGSGDYNRDNVAPG